MVAEELRSVVRIGSALFGDVDNLRRFIDTTNHHDVPVRTFDQSVARQKLVVTAFHRLATVFRNDVFAFVEVGKAIIANAPEN